MLWISEEELFQENGEENKSECAASSRREVHILHAPCVMIIKMEVVEDLDATLLFRWHVILNNGRKIPYCKDYLPSSYCRSV